MALAEYHHVWLANHPERSSEWLIARLADGFDLHHVDGDHSNNEPDNLVLIEHFDHMRLHNRPGQLGRLSEHRAVRVAKRLREREEISEAVGPVAYTHRLNRRNWRGWSAIRSDIDLKSAKEFAKKYAKTNGLPWPLPSGGSYAGDY